MAEALASEQVPLIAGPDGTILIRGTRVTLETVVAAFTEGVTAEEIAQQYPSASLADIYQVIGYYLRHSTDLAPYLAERQHQAIEVRRANESKWSPDGVRDCLLARRPG